MCQQGCRLQDDFQGTDSYLHPGTALARLDYGLQGLTSKPAAAAGRGAALLARKAACKDT